MKRLFWLIPVLLVFMLLCACGMGGDKPAEPEQIDPQLKQKMAAPKLVHKDDKFELKLNIEKIAYKVGEPIVYSASLTYIGDQESFVIWGPKHYMGFYLTDGGNIHMDGAATAELAPTKLMRGETQTFPFEKSGSYSEDDPDAKFWRTFYREKDLLLPAGTYLIGAKGVFSLDEEDINSHYDGEVYATITVTE